MVHGLPMYMQRVRTRNRGRQAMLMEKDGALKTVGQWESAELH